MNNINFELYRIFCKVAKNKNISKTAEELFISQSAITQSIQKLEKILKEKLFYRNKTGVELTYMGKNLYEHIKESIEILDNTETIFYNYSNLDNGILRIGGGNTLISSLILDTLCDFSKQYPNIKISISNGFTDDLIEKVSKGELDLVTLNTPYKGKKFESIEIIPVKESSYSLFISKEYFKKHNLKEIQEIQNHKLILPKKQSSRYKIFEIAFQEYNFNIETSFEVASSLIVKKLVLNNMGIGFCETESLKDIKEKIVVIKEVKFNEDTQSIAVLKANSQSNVTKEFLKFLLKYKQQ